MSAILSDAHMYIILLSVYPGHGRGLGIKCSYFDLCTLFMNTLEVDGKNLQLYSERFPACTL